MDLCAGFWSLFFFLLFVLTISTLSSKISWTKNSFLKILHIWDNGSTENIYISLLPMNLVAQILLPTDFTAPDYIPVLQA